MVFTANAKKIGRALFFSTILISGFGPQQSLGFQTVEQAGRSADGSHQNLVLSLEGPFAVQEHIDGHPGKLRILIPRVKDHFEPGFDADLDQYLLCDGDYSIELDGHKPAMTTRSISTSHHNQPIVIDTVGIADPPEPGYRISVLVDTPEALALTGPTEATVTGEHGDMKAMYASKMLLLYTGINSIMVKKTDKKTCHFGGILFQTEWTPSFAQLGGDLRLALSMVPSVTDSSHKPAKKSYSAIAKMLGIKRSVDFPTHKPFYGPHNDCLAPLIRVRPLEINRQ